jgi:hypothetical protein
MGDGQLAVIALYRAAVMAHHLEISLGVSLKLDSRLSWGVG